MLQSSTSMEDPPNTKLAHSSISTSLAVAHSADIAATKIIIKPSIVYACDGVMTEVSRVTFFFGDYQSINL